MSSDAPTVEVVPPTQERAQNGNAAAGGTGDEYDKLSDYIPQSGDLSRAPTASASASRVVSKAGTPERSFQEKDEDGDQSMGDAASSPSKTPRQLEKERDKVERSEARKGELAKRAAQNAGLSTKREELKQSKLADSMKRFGYLLGQTELFQHFIDIKKERDPAFAALLEESESKAKGKGKKKGGAGGDSGGNRRRKTEKEEDEELLEEEEDESFIFSESPPYVKGGTMRPYQVAGLNWMM